MKGDKVRKTSAVQKDHFCEVCGFRIKRFGAHATKVRIVGAKSISYVHTICLKKQPPYDLLQQ